MLRRKQTTFQGVPTEGTCLVLNSIIALAKREPIYRSERNRENRKEKRERNTKVKKKSQQQTKQNKISKSEYFNILIAHLH